MTVQNAACIKNILLSLRSELPALAANESSLALFDEFVREEEFGLAANVLCDCLAQQTPVISTAVLDRIKELYRMMHLEDPCLEELIAKVTEKPIRENDEEPGYTRDRANRS